MTQQIHGHEIMEMMLSSSVFYTKESLCQEIISKFGEETRYYTCAQDNMTAKELVEFLESRGKFVGSESGFNTSADKICNH
ncbi:MAG: YecH family metal-binding protein [Flavobacteriaceae bacterium]